MPFSIELSDEAEVDFDIFPIITALLRLEILSSRNRGRYPMPGKLHIEPHTGFSIEMISIPRLHYACRRLFSLNPIRGTA